jgi:hypothetical protein
MTKYYITKYALSKGVMILDAEKTGTEGMIRGCPNQYFHPPDWHESWDEARLQIQKMRLAKIKSLKKQLDKLESMSIDELRPKEDQDINL